MDAEGLYRKAFSTGSCPACGSGKIRVYCTTRPRRFWKCDICGVRWKSLEIVEAPFWLSRVLSSLLAEGRLQEYDYLTRKAIMAICAAEPGEIHKN